MSEQVERAILTLDETYSKLVDDDGQGKWRCGICELGWHDEMDDIVHGPDCFAGRILDAKSAVEAQRKEIIRLRELATELVNIEDMGDLKYIVEDFVAALEEQEAQDEQ